MPRTKKETVENLDADNAPVLQDEPKAKAPKYVLGQKYLFKNDDNDFIASIESLEPLKVIQHSVVGGCQSEMELSIDSLDEYEIIELPEDEIFRRLAMA